MWRVSVTLNTDISNKACSKFQQDLGPDMNALEVELLSQAVWLLRITEKEKETKI